MNLHLADIIIIVAFLLTSVLVGYWVSHRASTRHQGLLPGRQHLALVFSGRLQRLRHVRYRRDHVAGLPAVHLRAEERLDSLAVAGLQPDFPDGLPVHLAAPLERDHRRRVDPHALRHGPRRAAFAPDRGDLRAGQRHRLPHLRLQRHRQIRGRFPALASLRQRVRADPDGHHHVLRGEGRHVQRGHHRGAAVLHPFGRLDRHRHHRHRARFAGSPAPRHPGRVGPDLLRLASEPGLVRTDRRGEYQDRRGRLHASSAASS